MLKSHVINKTPTIITHTKPLLITILLIIMLIPLLLITGCNKDDTIRGNIKKENDIKVEIRPAGCKAAQEAGNQASQGASADVEEAIKKAESCIGKPYEYGATGPDSFDCSGLVCYCFGYDRGRTTTDMIASLKETNSWKTSIDQLQRGDLFFPHDGHVCIYLGNNEVIHAPRPGKTVTKVSCDVWGSFLGGGPYFQGGSSSANSQQSHQQNSSSNATKNALLQNSLIGDSNEEKVWNYLMNDGFTEEAAAAVMGNVGGESSFDPANVQSSWGSGAAGAFQWETYGVDGTRWGNMRDYCQSQGKEWTDLLAQLQFFTQEIAETFEEHTGPSTYGHYGFGEHAAYGWPDPMTAEEFKALKDINLATQIFSQVYERPGTPNMDNRIKYANDFFAQFTGTTPSKSQAANTLAEECDAKAGTNIANQVQSNEGFPDVNWGLSKNDFIKEWGPRIDKNLEGKTLHGYGNIFAEAAYDNHIHPAFSQAISIVESTGGDHCFREHNAWGWGNSGWDSWEEAIKAHAKGLAEGYGEIPTEEGAQKYCPPTWEDWYQQVCAAMQI